MKCNPSFFGQKKMPDILITKEQLEKLAADSISMGLTVPGVQKKLSLHLSDEGSSRMTLIGYSAGYILKPQSDDFSQLPEAEDLAMDIADCTGVNTAPHGLIDLNGEYAFITKRTDREGGKVYAMEDFCQLSGKQTQDKYKSSYERCAAIIKQYSSLPGYDLSEFFLRLVVCFVTGNSDMHLKNFSLIERVPGSRQYMLSPAYDFLPVNLVMPEDKEETALTLNGKKAGLKRSDFLALAKNIGVNEKAAVRMISSVVKKEKDILDLCESSYLCVDMKTDMSELIRERVSRIR